MLKRTLLAGAASLGVALMLAASPAQAQIKIATAGPITSTLSNRPAKQNEGSRACVVEQHLARRTQIRHTRPWRTGRW